MLALGSATDAIGGLAEAANIAEVALSIRDDDRPYFGASDVRLRSLVSLLRDDPRVQQFAETELKPFSPAEMVSHQRISLS